MTITCTDADLTDLAETYESRANHARGIAEKARQAGIRHRQHGIADAMEDAAKLARKKIEARQPRSALRLVSNEGAA